VGNDLRLPPGETAEVELDLDDERLRRLRERAEPVAPEDDDALLRYLVYLGVGYAEAERAAAGTPAEADARLRRLLGAVEGELAVLRFHYAESAREYAEETRARAAHERMAGAHRALVEKLEAEIAAREARIANLEAALGR
jgi:hypothetical protein